jgi:hypothetical protein
MPGIAARCHELRIQDQDKTWRIVYRIDRDAIVIAQSALAPRKKAAGA